MSLITIAYLDGPKHGTTAIIPTDRIDLWWLDGNMLTVNTADTIARVVTSPHIDGPLEPVTFVSIQEAFSYVARLCPASRPNVAYSGRNG